MTDEEAIEQIDIGGPTLDSRGGKKSCVHGDVTSAEQYAAILDQIAKHGGTTLELRRAIGGRGV